ncbi:MAG: hypothetical protein M9887_07800 [Chitinophagales bacterium]|nr:hypothetical protein [Chitinophagales bacterium]
MAKFQNYRQLKKWTSYFIVVIIFGSLVLTTSLLPKQVTITEQKELYGKMGDVDVQFEDLSNWKNWSVWHRDNNDDSTYTIKWSRFFDFTTKGKIVKEKSNDKMASFSLPMSHADTIYTNIHLEIKDQHTFVEWKSTIRLHSYLRRYFYFFVERWLIRDIRTNLNNLSQYFFNSELFAGWISDSYYLLDSKGVINYVIKDRCRVDNIDSVAFYYFKDIEKNVKRIYNREASVYVYQQAGKIENDSAEFIFLGTLGENEKVTQNHINYDGRYMQIRFLGGSKMKSLGIKKAKEIAKKEKFQIDTEPLIVYSSKFLETEKVKKLDTNMMTMSFRVVKTNN